MSHDLNPAEMVWDELKDKHEFTGELDGCDGGGVVVQSLFQTVVLLQVEDVD